ncbi:hypothetical protein O181_050923 [Austropuccinia psidii MF-1]|uniref:Integrase catalytic domain-containing protein n=1 Tax=Austropuccinia psidii MF-1 TaxID=1389203 RepID=A0A9Q3HMU4_9BASI|nr:hypothetical protein [Austropuccinia psidii MF-1]
METQHDCSLKKLVSDQGGEFLNSHFQQLANECGFVHSFSPAYTPEHNSFAERANRTILEKTRCMLHATNIPNSYWAETVSTATLLSNSVPTLSRHNHLPHTLWTGLPPRIKKLRVFGCQAIVMTPKEHRDSKLGPTGVAGILLGYESNNSAYRVLCLLNRKILISRHVNFNELVFPELKHQSDDQLPLSLPWEALDEPLPEHQPLPNLTPDISNFCQDACWLL